MATAIRTLAATALAAGLACAASSASATTYLITFSGTTNEAIDPHGLFNGPNPELDSPFTATVQIDTTLKPGASPSPYFVSAPGIQGITGFDAGSSPLEALSVTINGVTVSCASFSGCGSSYDLQYIGEIYRYDGDETVFYDEDWTSPDGQTYYQLSFEADGYAPDGALAGNDLNTFVSLNGTPSEFFIVNLNLETDYPDGSYNYEGFYTLSASSSVQVVPEPATWALMIAGFGLAGAALRTRRRRLA
jgi:hypothetical protein